MISSQPHHRLITDLSWPHHGLIIDSSSSHNHTTNQIIFTIILLLNSILAPLYLYVTYLQTLLPTRNLHIVILSKYLHISSFKIYRLKHFNLPTSPIILCLILFILKLKFEFCIAYFENK